MMCTISWVLTKSKTKLVSYSGHKVKPIGKCTLLAERNGKFYPIEFHVVKQNVQLILGLPECKRLGLIILVGTLNDSQKTKPSKASNDQDILKRYQDVFQGIGCLSEKQHITIDESVPPVIHPSRKVPVSRRPL